MDMDPDFKKLLAQEDLILEVTENLIHLMKQEGVTREELAKKMKKQKGYIESLLNSGHNLTVRTIADIAQVLGYRLSIKAEKIKEKN